MILQHMNSLSSFRIIFAFLNQIIHLNNAVCAISFGSCFLDAYIYFILVKGRILLKISIMSVSKILILFLLTAKSDCETCLSLFRVAISLKIYIHIFLLLKQGGGLTFLMQRKILVAGLNPRLDHAVGRSWNSEVGARVYVHLFITYDIHEAIPWLQ